MRFKQVALPLALILAACGAKAADVPSMTVASVADLASLFEGEFTTLPNPSGTTQAPALVLYNLAKRVQVPALGQDVVYAEQHEKAPDGPMLWQRLYAFELDHDKGLIVMTPYSFGNGKDLAGAYANPTPLAKLEPSAVKQQTNGCIVLWHRSEAGFDGVLKPGSCKDAAASPKAAAQSAVSAPAITVTKTTYTEQPQGGSSTPIVFRRIH